jgi:hypothetical protein
VSDERDNETIHMHGFSNLLQVFALAFKATEGSDVSFADVP